MDKNLYANVINDTLKWAKGTKARGEFYPCIQSHMTSKIGGMLEVAMKDRDLTVEDFKWLSDLALERTNDIWRIICDTEE